MGTERALIKIYEFSLRSGGGVKFIVLNTFINKKNQTKITKLND